MVTTDNPGNVMDRLLVGVTATDDVQPAMVQFLHNLAAEMRVCIGNDSAMSSLANGLESDADVYARAVLAGTPKLASSKTAPVETHPWPSEVTKHPEDHPLTAEERKAATAHEHAAAPHRAAAAKDEKSSATHAPAKK